MNKIPTIILMAFFTTILVCGAAYAKWSLLEDYEMNDIAGDEGLCLSSIKKPCDFEILNYTETYPYDKLRYDMDDSRAANAELISDDIWRFRQETPFPTVETTFETPTPGDPFFQSDWYSPGLTLGWDSLYKHLLEPPAGPGHKGGY